MSHSPEKTDWRRAGEWVAAAVGAINCVGIPLLFTQSGAGDFPFPFLYFLQIALVGLAVLVYTMTRTRLSPRWQGLPWVAAGIILAFVILGGFSIGPFLVPALLAFVALGVLIDWEAGRRAIAGHFGLFTVAAVAQGVVMVGAIWVS